MTRATAKNPIIIRSVRRTPVYKRQQFRDAPGGHIAEVAGGTTAECAAVWCCCPCTMVNLLVLAVYKLPAGICRKALRKHKKRRMINKGLLPLSSSANSNRHGRCQCRSHWESDEFHIMELGSVPKGGHEVTMVVVGANEMDNDLLELEREMWNKFHNTGFWRSPSQREQ